MGFIKNAVVGAGLASLAVAHPNLDKRLVSGSIIYSCVVKGDVALTFDDGPSTYTQGIVDLLTNSGNKATFFQNGDNYGNLLDYGPLLKSMLDGGHQIASHTYSHADLAKLDAAGVTNEMALLEADHLALIGKAPTYMRPPYLSTTDETVATLTALGYNIISVDVDTLDYDHNSTELIGQSITLFEDGVNGGGSIVLNHDPYLHTFQEFVPAAIDFLKTKGLKSVTVGTCLGDPEANWYRAGSVAKPPVSGSVSASGSALPSAVPSGNGTAPYPTGPASYHPTITGYPPRPTVSKKPCGGGDTEPGHGPDAGRGALPGKKGQGNDGWVPPANGTATYPNTTAAVTPGPSYYVNSASSFTFSALALSAAVFALFL